TGGDYSYSLINLPFNILGNTLGYFMLSLLGPISLPLYNMLRVVARENIGLTIFITLLLAGAFYLAYRFLRSYVTKMDKEDKKILVFGLLFAFIATLPFLDFGN